MSFRVYVAGPMRGLSEFNFPAFDAASDSLRHLGHFPINPAKHDRDNGFDPVDMDGHEDLSALGFNLAKALAWDLDQITKSEAIYLLYGWEKSSGARAEYALAQALGLAIASDELWDDSRQRDVWLSPEEFAKYHGLPHERLTTEEVMAPPVGEVRITSATGGEKGQKLAQVGSVDPTALLRVAEVAGFGASKYARLNFLKGYDWSLSFDALQRHLLLFWAGQNNDDESGLPHVAHAAWHCLALLAFAEHGLGTDDRYRKE